ncbi:MAG: Glycosyl transferases group 1 [Candidatus Argoarchaeum ethanivorans]|uniref:Glycosyl transferases group 1 n=1 Tax=Candidatus Argoarchaeum ethanivorans TaxID=2608793 RepID=A0A811T5D3_9EURY|nr:MAG: Glycosyl transferases group 1 [Candidatus Argoarchaeum ethanivorans]
MKILIVVAYFVPEIASAAHVYFDLARAFVKKGHEVDIITSYPRKFNLNKNDADKESSLEETIDGIGVHRCKHFARRDNIVMRGLEHFLLPRYYFKTYRQIDKKFDVCLIYIPPLPLYYFARKIKRYDDTPSVLNYQDFHPQELTDVGVMKNKLMIKIMEYIEKKSYKNADYITVLSKGGMDYVVKKGGNPNKIKHIYNGVLLSDFEKYLMKKDFKKKEGIKNKILISYSGILSPFQGVDNILNAAKKLSDYEDLIFYIVGDGMLKNHLENRIRDEKIFNVKLLPLQPREEYFNIINSSDISTVSLDDRMKAPCLPGKLINLLALKQPIIAIVPNDSETAQVIQKAKCGVVVEPGNTEELERSILKLKDNIEFRKELGENGREFLEENMILEENVAVYEEIFNLLLNQKIKRR